MAPTNYDRWMRVVERLGLPTVLVGVLLWGGWRIAEQHMQTSHAMTQEMMHLFRETQAQVVHSLEKIEQESIATRLEIHRASEALEDLHEAVTLSIGEGKSRGHRNVP